MIMLPRTIVKVVVRTPEPHAFDSVTAHDPWFQVAVVTRRDYSCVGNGQNCLPRFMSESTSETKRETVMDLSHEEKELRDRFLRAMLEAALPLQAGLEPEMTLTYPQPR
jgi:hypothetical protein